MQTKVIEILHHYDEMVIRHPYATKALTHSLLKQPIHSHFEWCRKTGQVWVREKYLLGLRLVKLVDQSVFHAKVLMLKNHKEFRIPFILMSKSFSQLSLNLTSYNNSFKCI